MKKEAMPIIFHMPPWSVMWLLWGLCYFRFHAEMFSAEFTRFLGKSQLEGEKLVISVVHITARKLRLHIPHLSYTFYQGGIRKIIGIAIFFIKCLTGY